MNELISIVIPVYNLEAYLQNCIESVIAQTYNNLEIILIDDGSTDGSIQICRKYEKSDQRIRVIRREKNAGAGAARNAGIDIAKGAYIMFVDGDDFIAGNCIEEMYSLLRKGNGDISVCCGKRVYDVGRIKDVEENSLGNYECMTARQALEHLCYQRKITPGPWGKLFKMELFNDIRFPDTGYEDLAIIYRLLDLAKVIVFSPVEKYYYLQRRNNTTLGKFNRKKLDRVSVAEQMMEFMEREYPDLYICVKVRFFIANVQTLYVLPFCMLYSRDGKMIGDNIRKYRWAVWNDKNAKLSSRCMALMSYTGMFSLKLLGVLYDFCRGNFKARLE